MKYDVTVLLKMIEVETRNIVMCQGDMVRATKSNSLDQVNTLEKRIAEMVANRRLLAAMVENDGEEVAPEYFSNGNVFFNLMDYACSTGEDTSWWG